MQRRLTGFEHLNVDCIGGGGRLLLGLQFNEFKRSKRGIQGTAKKQSKSKNLIDFWDFHYSLVKLPTKNVSILILTVLGSEY